MIYTVKRIDEDLDFGCEERAKDAPVMAVVTLVDSSGEELRVKAEDALLYKNNINEGDKVCYDKNDPDSVYQYYRRLLALRARYLSPALKGAEAIYAAPLGTHGVVAKWRLGNGASWTLVCNLGATSCDFEMPPGNLVFGMQAGGAAAPRTAGRGGAERVSSAGSGEGRSPDRAVRQDRSGASSGPGPGRRGAVAWLRKARQPRGAKK